MKFRIVVTGLLAATMCACSTTQIKATRIKSGIIYAPAIRIADPDSPTGHMQSSKSVDGIIETTYIPAELGKRFGTIFVLIGPQQGLMLDYQVVWRFPEPGLTNPKTQITQHIYRHTNQCKVGALCGATWSLTEPFEVVPGEWELELRIKDAPFFTQTFEVYTK